MRHPRTSRHLRAFLTCASATSTWRLLAARAVEIVSSPHDRMKSHSGREVVPGCLGRLERHIPSTKQVRPVLCAVTTVIHSEDERMSSVLNSYHCTRARWRFVDVIVAFLPFSRRGGDYVSPRSKYHVFSAATREGLRYRVLPSSHAKVMVYPSCARGRKTKIDEDTLAFEAKDCAMMLKYKVWTHSAGPQSTFRKYVSLFVSLQG